MTFPQGRGRAKSWLLAVRPYNLALRVRGHMCTWENPSTKIGRGARAHKPSCRLPARAALASPPPPPGLSRGSLLAPRCLRLMLEGRPGLCNLPASPTQSVPLGWGGRRCERTFAPWNREPGGQAASWAALVLSLSRAMREAPFRPPAQGPAPGNHRGPGREGRRWPALGSRPGKDMWSLTCGAGGHFLATPAGRAPADKHWEGGRREGMARKQQLLPPA